MVTKLVGTWRLKSSENFDEYLGAVGVGFMWRKLAATAKPDVIIEEKDGEWIITTKATFKTTVLKFKLGEEFGEVRGDGKELQTTVEDVDGKLVQTQKAAGVNGEDSVITRELNEDGIMLTTMAVGSVVCKREYTKAT
ncbi:unnamed protein product [Cyprideis torosa]|uniref:Uncharacterized protein n=1 Tax=Cyprideis torosa TaxID=163714 RepID=A0A7R8WIS9_9CRUS|nr:unnamed protein product [Cyprideis torosa]CAG0901049.1 unnamed protein product [Cyprideis torosa]